MTVGSLKQIVTHHDHSVHCYAGFPADASSLRDSWFKIEFITRKIKQKTLKFSDRTL